MLRETTRQLWSSRLWVIAVTALAASGLGAAPAGAELVSGEEPIEVAASTPAPVTESAPSTQPPPAPPVEAESTTPPAPVSAPSAPQVLDAAPTSAPVSAPDLPTSAPVSAPDLNVRTQRAILKTVTEATEPVTDAARHLPETDAVTRMPSPGGDLIEAAQEAAGQLPPLDKDVPAVVDDTVNGLRSVPPGGPVNKLADEPVAGTTPPSGASPPGADGTVAPDDSSRIFGTAVPFGQTVLDPVGAPIEPQSSDAAPASTSGGIRSDGLHLYTAGGMATSLPLDRGAEPGGPEAPGPLTQGPAPSPSASSGPGGSIFVPPIAALLALLALSVPAILRRLREVGGSAPGPLACALERPG